MSQTPFLLIAAFSGRARKPTAPERPSELSPTRPFVATSSLDVAHTFLRAGPGFRARHYRIYSELVSRTVH